jgi:ribosomal protein S18 acetylase RimI-like enzyme
VTVAAGAEGEQAGFAALLGVLDLLAGVAVRVGGGWGVDLLIGRVTRAHHDIDLFVPSTVLDEALRRLGAAGFSVVDDETPCRVVLASTSGERVDLGGIDYRPDGHGVQGDSSGDMEIFPAWGWTERVVAGRRVTCLSAEAQRLKHRGYPARPSDAGDLASIAHIDEPARFDPTVRPVEDDEADLVKGIEEVSDRLLEPFGAWPLPASCPAAKAAERDRTAATLVAARPPVGFLRLEVVDGHAHLGQLSVLPEYGRMGIGTSLVAAACDWARQRGHRLITLTTFADIPFNAPFYRRLGFRQLGEEEIGPELRQVISDEADLERFGRRVTMARTLADGDRSAATAGWRGLRRG